MEAGASLSNGEVRQRCEGVHSLLKSKCSSRSDWLLQVAGVLQGHLLCPPRRLIVAGGTTTGREALFAHFQAVSSDCPALAVSAALGLPAALSKGGLQASAVEILLNAFESVACDPDGRLLASVCMAAIAMTDCEHACATLSFIDQQVAERATSVAAAVEGIRLLASVSVAASDVLLHALGGCTAQGSWTALKVALLLWEHPTDHCSPWQDGFSQAATAVIVGALTTGGCIGQELLHLAESLPGKEVPRALPPLVRLVPELLQHCPRLHGFAVQLAASLFRHQPDQRALTLQTLLDTLRRAPGAAHTTGATHALKAMAACYTAGLGPFVPLLQEFVEDAIWDAADPSALIARVHPCAFCLAKCAQQGDQAGLGSVLVDEALRRMASPIQAAKLAGLCIAHQLTTNTEPTSTNGIFSMYSAVNNLLRREVIGLCAADRPSEEQSDSSELFRWTLATMEMSLLILANSWQSKDLAARAWNLAVGPTVQCMLVASSQSSAQGSSSRREKPLGCNSSFCVLHPACIYPAFKCKEISTKAGSPAGSYQSSVAEFMVQSSQAALLQVVDPTAGDGQRTQWAAGRRTPLPEVLQHYASKDAQHAVSIARFILQLLTTSRLVQSCSKPCMGSSRACTCWKQHGRDCELMTCSCSGDSTGAFCAYKAWTVSLASTLAGIEACVEHLPKPGQDVSCRQTNTVNRAVSSSIHFCRAQQDVESMATLDSNHHSSGSHCRYFARHFMTGLFTALRERQSLLLPIWFSALQHSRTTADSSGDVAGNVLMWQLALLMRDREEVDAAPSSRGEMWPFTQLNLKWSLPHWVGAGWVEELVHQAFARRFHGTKPVANIAAAYSEESVIPLTSEVTAVMGLAILTREAVLSGHPRTMLDVRASMTKALSSYLIGAEDSGKVLVWLLRSQGSGGTPSLSASLCFGREMVRLFRATSSGAHVTSVEEILQSLERSCIRGAALTHEVLQDAMHFMRTASLCEKTDFSAAGSLHGKAQLQELYAFHADMSISLANDLLGLQSKVRLMAHAMEALKETHATTTPVSDSGIAWLSAVYNTLAWHVRCLLVSNTPGGQHGTRPSSSAGSLAGVTAPGDILAVAQMLFSMLKYCQDKLMKDSWMHFLPASIPCSHFSGVASDRDQWCFDATLEMILDVAPIMGRLAAVVSHHMNPTEPSAHDSEKALAQQLSAVSTSVVEAAQELCCAMECAVEVTVRNHLDTREDGCYSRLAALLAKTEAQVMRIRNHLQRQDAVLRETSHAARTVALADKSTGAPEQLLSPKQQVPRPVGAILEKLEPSAGGSDVSTDGYSDDESGFFIEKALPSAVVDQRSILQKRPRERD